MVGYSGSSFSFRRGFENNFIEEIGSMPRGSFGSIARISNNKEEGQRKGQPICVDSAGWRGEHEDAYHRREDL